MKRIELTAKVEQARKVFGRSLPQRCVCTKCNKKRDTFEAFGVRLMNGKKVAKKNAEPKFLRQSQCKSCRGAKPAAK